jgi:hypothetical protein
VVSTAFDKAPNLTIMPLPISDAIDLLPRQNDVSAARSRLVIPPRVGVMLGQATRPFAPVERPKRSNRTRHLPPVRNSTDSPRATRTDPAVAHAAVCLALEDAHFVAEHHQLDVLVEPSSA